MIHLRSGIDRNILIAVVLFGTWFVLLVLSPMLIPSGSVTDLSGRVLVLDNMDAYRDMNPLSKTIYILGDYNCHQINERSLFINDNQMPFCTRDVGIFIGLLVGAVIALFVFIRFKLTVLLIGFVPLVVDGALQLATDYESANAIRIATGALAGAMFALFLCEKIAVPTEREIISENLEA